MINRLYLILLLSSSLLANPSLATSFAPAIAKDENLFSLTLKQLLQVIVTSSSGVEESLIDAPAAMLIISAKQIEQRGYHNINEILVDLHCNWEFIVSNCIAYYF